MCRTSIGCINTELTSINYTPTQPQRTYKPLINTPTNAHAGFYWTLQHTHRTYLSHHRTYTSCPQTYHPYISARIIATSNPPITLIHRTHAPTIRSHFTSRTHALTIIVPKARPLHLSMRSSHLPIAPMHPQPNQPMHLSHSPTHPPMHPPTHPPYLPVHTYPPLSHNRTYHHTHRTHHCTHHPAHRTQRTHQRTYQRTHRTHHCTHHTYTSYPPYPPPHPSHPPPHTSFPHIVPTIPTTAPIAPTTAPIVPYISHPHTHTVYPWSAPSVHDLSETMLSVPLNFDKSPRRLRCQSNAMGNAFTVPWKGRHLDLADALPTLRTTNLALKPKLQLPFVPQTQLSCGTDLRSLSRERSLGAL